MNLGLSDGCTQSSPSPPASDMRSRLGWGQASAATGLLADHTILRSFPRAMRQKPLFAAHGLQFFRSAHYISMQPNLIHFAGHDPEASPAYVKGK